MNTPDFDSDFDPAVMAHFFPAFARAKWVTGLIGVNEKNFHLLLTPLGQQRMSEIAECSKAIFPQMWSNTERSKGTPALAGAIATLAAIAVELGESNLDEKHKIYLFALAILYIKTPPPQPPPSRI